MLLTELTNKQKIVLNRWRARQFFWEAWRKMPTTLTIRNAKDGGRLEEEDRYDVCLLHTLNMLCEIGQKIFFRNHNKHYAGISTESAGRIAYAVTPDDKFQVSRRVKTRLGRYITRNFEEIVTHEDFNERALDMLVEKFTALAAEDIENIFKIEKGEEIVTNYRDEFADDSCMTGSGARYTQMYAANPDVVSMLCLDDGRYKGRALLWSTDDGQVLDRIYPNSGPHIEKYELYCAKHEIDMRNDNYCPCSSPTDEVLPQFNSVQTRKRKTYSVQVKVPNTDCIPYMDLFHFGAWLNGNRNDATEAKLYSAPTEDGVVPDFVASGTGGDISTYEYHECLCCSETVFRHACEYLIDAHGARSLDNLTCQTCMDNEEVKYCEGCSNRMLETNSILIKGINEQHGNRYCIPCAIKRLRLCKTCNEVNGYHIMHKDDNYCRACYIQALAKSITQTPLEKELAIKESITNEFTQS
tara:strand:- start:3890 stop:5296 length:1407 start_codon:yes stop_codon:yes gene_type:complete